MSATIILIIITAIVSLIAFNKESVFSKLCLHPASCWQQKEWFRMLSSGFLHADYAHLIFNMISLYFAGSYLESFFDYRFGSFGKIYYVLFYLVAIVIANIPDTFQQKSNNQFFAVGASGGVSAVLFGFILLDPMELIYIKMIFPIPAFAFGIGYLLYSAYMAKKGEDNIGHLAHFTGAAFGFIFPILFTPSLLPMFFSKIHF